jgi:predicted dienelactone hydrolase
MTSAFVDGARLMADALGAPGYAFAVIDHPISSAADAELEARARDALRQAAAILALA